MAKPWRDVDSVEEWKSVVDAYSSGDLTSKSATIGRWFRSRGSEGRVLPKQIRQITLILRFYHDIPKDDLRLFPVRINALTTIANAAQSYLIKYKIGVTVKSSKDDKGNFTSMDAYVWSMANRARRKAGYLQTLIHYYERQDERQKKGKGRSTSKDLIDYLLSPQNNHDGLLRLHVNERMEKEDPFHREFTLDIREDGVVNIDPFKSMALAFGQWCGLLDYRGDTTSKVKLQDVNPDPTPFFVWLENHAICLGPRSSKVVSLVNSVEYHRKDKGDWEGITWCSPYHGFLQTINQNTESALLVPFDTMTSAFPGKPGEENTAAYVWTVGNDIFAADHKGGRFHHSSFVSGKKVRCAGMIRVKKGKVTLVSNNSGHYRPKLTHLKAFVMYLDQENLFAHDAVVVSLGLKEEDFKSRSKDEFLKYV
jgi:hypothetical protein